MSQIVSYGLVAFCVCALAAGQIMFKFVSGRTQALADIVANRETFFIFVAAAALYGASTLAWIVALRSIPLSQAYLFMALGFVIVPVAAHFVFGEPLPLRLLVGAALVCAGIWVAAIA
jgi:multidrug transporter EmrE-like cation transporter